MTELKYFCYSEVYKCTKP